MSSQWVCECETESAGERNMEGGRGRGGGIEHEREWKGGGFVN